MRVDDDVTDRMPLHRDEGATITVADGGAPLGHCRVRARFEPRRSGRRAGFALQLSDVVWSGAPGPKARERYAVSFPDGYAVVVQFTLPGLDDSVVLCSLRGPGGEHIG